MKRSASSSPLQFTIDPETVYISANPDQSSYANITVTVENITTEPVDISAFAITLPASLAPATSLGSITAGSNVAGEWTFGPSLITSGEFDANVITGNYVSLPPGTPWQFTLSMVTLNNSVVPSSAMVTAVATFADGTSGPTVSLNIDIAAALVSIIYFNSTPSDINPGDAATLNWKCAGIDSCSISPLGLSGLNSFGTYQVEPNATTSYTLYAYAPGVILAAQWQLTVENPQIVEFGGVNGQTNLNCGDTLDLVWICNDATATINLTSNNNTYIPVNLFINGNTVQQGSITVGPVTQPTIFTLTAHGSDSENFIPANAVISINDVTATLTATPDSGLWAGDVVTLTWDIVSAASVSLSPAVQNGPSLQNLSGSAHYNPGDDGVNIQFVLTVTGFIDGDATTITNEPPLTLDFQDVIINDFSITPAPITPDTTSINQGTLSWNTQAQVVSIDNNIGPVNPVDSLVINTPVNGTVYTLTAGTNQNPALQTQQVTVVDAFGPYTFTSFNPNTTLPTFLNLNVPNPGPMGSLSQGIDGGYQASITGIIATNFPDGAWYFTMSSYSEDDGSYFILSYSPEEGTLPAFEWADPNNQSGTITLSVVPEGDRKFKALTNIKSL